MLRLPSLLIHGQTLRFPIPTSVGWKLAAVLVETSSAETALELTQLLRTEPALLTWTAVQCGNGDGSQTVATLAECLLPTINAAAKDWRSIPLAADSPWHSWLAAAKNLGEHLPQVLSLMETSLPALAAETISDDQDPESADRLLARVLTGIVAQRQPQAPCRLPLDAAVERAKHQALYQFAYGLSHEINNPLANIATRAQTLLQDEIDPERKRRLATINAQAFRAHEMLADLMLYAKPPALQCEDTKLGSLLTKIVRELQPTAAEQETELTLEAAADVSVHCDPIQIEVAVRALLRNSLEALDHGGKIGVRLSSTNDFIAIQVHDNGPGIPLEHRSHLFDPFFSGREAGRGLGLGLSKCWRIAELHHGQVTCDVLPAGGTLFTLQLPQGGRE
jgi:signal transduction histidine kinase